MAPLKSQLSIPLAINILLLLNSWPVVAAAAGNYTAIFSLGDSLTDTGNYLLSGHKPAQVANPPYGETYFHRPSGRFSNGRIVIDFVAQALGLPLVRPYLAGGSGKDFRYGANFAVGGATALDNDFFRRRGYNATWTEYSLGHQMKWFKKVLHLLSLSGSGSSHEILSKSLVLMEIGGNDYIESLINQRSINETTSLVPLVAKKIVHVTKNLIKLGARRVVVPGITPLGCTATFLTMFQQKNEGAQGYYDPSTGCINWLNDLAKYHNKVVKDSVARLQRRYPHATITYADYYENCMSIYKGPAKDGFKGGLVACCGGGGPFNVALNLMCGDKGNNVCSDPSSYVCWDGVHFTESANKILASGFLYGPYLAPPIL